MTLRIYFELTVGQSSEKLNNLYTVLVQVCWVSLFIKTSWTRSRECKTQKSHYRHSLTHSIVRDPHTVLTLAAFIICCIEYASSRFIPLPITHIMDYYTNRLDERTRPNHCYSDTVPVGVAWDMDHIIWCLLNSPKIFWSELPRPSMTVQKKITTYGGLKYRSVTKTLVCPTHGNYV